MANALFDQLNQNWNYFGSKCPNWKSSCVINNEWKYLSEDCILARKAILSEQIIIDDLEGVTPYVWTIDKKFLNSLTPVLWPQVPLNYQDWKKKNPSGTYICF